MPKRSHREGCIIKRPDGIWTSRIQIGYNDKGKPKIKAFYGKTRKEVVDKLHDYKSLMQSGADESELPDFDTYIFNWLNNVKINELKPLSFDRLESTIKNHIIPSIGHFQTGKITDMIIQTELINKKARVMSYSSVKKIYDALNACFKYAIARRDLRYNPMATVSIPNKAKFKSKEIEIFSDDEVKKVEEVAKSQYSNGVLKFRNGWGIVLMIYTGIRMGEALALKWSDYDEGNKTLTIRKNIALIKNRTDKGAKYQLVEQGSLKTKNADRVIPLSQKAIESLLELMKTSKHYIISTKDGKPVRPRNFQNTFDSMLESVGIEHKGLHVTRHTFASLLFKRGADVKTVSELLGHADTRITYNTYIHLIKEQKQNVVSLLDG